MLPSKINFFLVMRQVFSCFLCSSVLTLVMPHIHIKHGTADRVFNTDQIVTVCFQYEIPEGRVAKRARCSVVTAADGLEYTLIGDNADEFWAKYQRLCVAQQRPEVG